MLPRGSRGVFGISYAEDGIRFAPCVPTQFGPGFYAVLNHFTYRGADMRVAVIGTGTEMERLLLDGKPVEVISPALTGRHEVRIEMKGHTEVKLPASI